jgi:signal transduction histidine kinase
MSGLWTRDEASKRGRQPPSAADDSANTAHDFGNVLQCATSALRVCERQLLDRGQPDLATMISDAQEALARASVLAVRLAGADRGRRAVLPVSVAEVILSMLMLLRQAVGDGVALQTVVADRLPPVLCDVLDLETVILNLTINAREAMPDGGRLTIQARPSMIGAAGVANGVTISVSDTGCGMTADVARRAFERSFSTKGDAAGRGLGLAAVRQFAGNAGGSVDLQSSVGGGTSVKLHLPAAPHSRPKSCPFP